MVALKNHYGNNFCNSIETQNDEKNKKLKLNIKSFFKIYSIDI